MSHLQELDLLDVPCESRLRLTEGWATFHHIDGMYSYCTMDDGRAFHLGALTRVKKVDDHYELL